jgi:6-pyruvoyltetrahydropterin/6-carboxytetrahydropterin synthase
VHGKFFAAVLFDAVMQKPSHIRIKTRGTFSKEHYAMITMTRRVTFSAAHAADSQNISHHAQYTGHNYTLDVGVRGKIDPQTGILVNIKDIDRIVREQIVDRLNGTLLNHAAPFFHQIPLTAENITEFIRMELENRMPPEAQLSELRLEWTPLHSVEWKRNQIHTMHVTHVYEFSASHRLHSDLLSAEENETLFGKCNRANGHGHNYVFEVTVSGVPDAQSGRVIDGDVLDELVEREIIERYDHRHLNLDVPEFQHLIPSAENITKVIYNRLADKIPSPARLSRVLVRETARNLFMYEGEKETDA